MVQAEIEQMLADAVRQAASGGVPCFLMSALPRSRRWLRRYSLNREPYVSTMVLLDDTDRAEGMLRDNTPESVLGPDWKSDPRWPTHAEDGYEFQPHEPYQVFERRLWQHPDGRQLTIEEFPPGAMFNADWMSERYRGADGLSLHVVLPNGANWCIDSQSSNCTRPNEPHKCWCRHGTVPDVTVDKNGDTCQAGGGSILTHKGQPDEWHGFLRNGRLVVC